MSSNRSTDTRARIQILVYVSVQVDVVVLKKYLSFCSGKRQKKKAEDFFFPDFFNLGQEGH